MFAKARWRGLTAVSFLCLAPGAGAQSVAAGPVTPGTAEDFFREAPRIRPDNAPPPSITPRPLIPPRLKTEVHVKGFVFSGNTLYTQEQLQAIARPLLKPVMSLGEIQLLAEQITERMHADGYLVASAAVPAQKIKDGLVRIDILEGKLESLRIIGNQRYSDERITSYLAPLQAAPALTDKALERSLLLLNELPGVTARGTLAPGAQYGQTNLDVEISERRFRAAAGLNNYGSPELGRARADLSLDFFNPLRIGDHVNVRLIEAQNSQLGLGRIGYDFALAPAWRVSLAAARIDYRVAGAFSALQLSGNSLTREASLAYAWVRTRGTSLTVTAGARDVRTNQEALGQSLGGLHVRAGYTTLSGYTTYGGGLTSGLAAITSNGRGQAGAGIAGDGIRLKTELDVTHARPLPGDFEISQRVALTLSPDALPDTEKFSLGGPDSVRAFPIAQLRGDEGFLSVTEVRRRFRFYNTQSYVGAFFDYGSMRLRQPMLPAYRDSLSGAGLTASVTHEHLRLKLDVARAISSDKAADGHRARIWLSATWLF
ncbi:MAG: polypeptide-transport-associated domain protein ShlB-type [Betaproteobacteria bacterium]|nr:polypeptide-transport-associated domain protein ShlB-type [Betaproteobacteria bacterium]